MVIMKLITIAKVRELILWQFMIALHFMMK